MSEARRLMAVLAHPDDESFAVGSTLARYAAEGVDVHLVTATRGERGRFFTGDERPGDDEVGEVREAELRRAAEELGLRDVHFLGYRDGDLDQADPEEAIGRIVGHIRRVRPQVVVTFDPFGAYGHPDHVAVCQLTTGAVAAAAGTGHPGTPHQVSKLYYSVMDETRWRTLTTTLEGLAERLERRERQPVLWPEWSHSAQIDARQHWKTAWRAIRCHRSQIALYEGLEALDDEEHRELWGRLAFYRALGLKTGGRGLETDLFAELPSP